MSDRGDPDIRMGVLRRMPLLAGRTSIGPDRWPLWALLQERSLTTHLDREPPLVSGIRSLVEGFFPAGEPGFWDFASEAPEGEILHLQVPPEEEAPEVLATTSRRGRRTEAATGARRTGKAPRGEQTVRPGASRASRKAGAGLTPPGPQRSVAATAPARRASRAPVPGRLASTRVFAGGRPVGSPRALARPVAPPSPGRIGLLHALRLRSAALAPVVGVLGAGTPWGPETPEARAAIPMPSLLSSVDLATLIRITATPSDRPADARDAGFSLVPRSREGRPVPVLWGPGIDVAGRGPEVGAVGPVEPTLTRDAGRFAFLSRSGRSIALPAGLAPSDAAGLKDLVPSSRQAWYSSGLPGDGESRLAAMGSSLQALQREVLVGSLPAMYATASTPVPEWVRLVPSRDAAPWESLDSPRAREGSPEGRRLAAHARIPHPSPEGRLAAHARVPHPGLETRQAARPGTPSWGPGGSSSQEPGTIAGGRIAPSPAFPRTPLSGSGILSPGTMNRTAVAVGDLPRTLADAGFSSSGGPLPGIPGGSHRLGLMDPIAPTGSLSRRTSRIPGVGRVQGPTGVAGTAGDLPHPLSREEADRSPSLAAGLPQEGFLSDPWIDRTFLPLVQTPGTRAPGEGHPGSSTGQDRDLGGSGSGTPRSLPLTAGQESAGAAAIGPVAPGKGPRSGTILFEEPAETPEWRLGPSLAAVTDEPAGWLVSVRPSDQGEDRPGPSWSWAGEAPDPEWVALPERTETPEALSRDDRKARPAIAGSVARPVSGLDQRAREDSRPRSPTGSPRTSHPIPRLAGVPVPGTRRPAGRRSPPGLSRVLQTHLAEASKGLLERRSAQVASRRIPLRESSSGLLVGAAAPDRRVRRIATGTPGLSSRDGLPLGQASGRKGLSFEPLPAPGGEPEILPVVAPPHGGSWNRIQEEPAGIELLRLPMGPAERMSASIRDAGPMAAWRWSTDLQGGRRPQDGMVPGSPETPPSTRDTGVYGPHHPGIGSLAGSRAEALAPLVRTLFRSLGAMPPVPRSAAMTDREGSSPGDLVAWIATVAAASRSAGPERTSGPWTPDRSHRGPGSPAPQEGRRSPAGAPFSEELPALVAGSLGDQGEARVQAEPGRSRLPGLPEGPAETDSPPLVEVSLGTTAPHLPAGIPGPGIGALPSGPAGGASDLPGPKYHGTLPLISTGVSAVSAAALASRDRPGERRPAESQDPASQQAREETARGQASLDLEGLAAEMTQRILRRLKREKERRGFHA